MDNKALTQLSNHIGLLLSEFGREAFCEQLLQFISEYVKCDSAVILLYRQGDRPRILADHMAATERQALQANYFDTTYLLSPYYLYWQSHPGPSVVRLTDLAPEGFFNSVYYTDYYAGSGLIDEAGYLVPLSESSAVLFLLGRTNQYLPPYTQDEMDFLESVRAIVATALQHHFSLVTLPPGTDIKTRLEDSLRLFGSSVLTERERHVVQLMLRGHSSKSCARELAISPATERVHRRNIHAKLGVASQAELFRLFFDALSGDNYRDGVDPLRFMSE